MIGVQIGDFTYQCPTSWDECTVRQFMKLKDWTDGDFIRLVSILTGVDYEIIAACNNMDIDTKLVPHMEWLEKPFPKSAERKTRVRVQGKMYDVPTDLAKYSFAQKIRLTERVAEEIKSTGSTVGCIPIAFAIYFQPIVTGQKFSTDAAVKFTDDVVMDCSVTDVVPVANFFLRICTVSNPVIMRTWFTNRIRNRWARKLANWMFSVISKRWTRWPVAIP